MQAHRARKESRHYQSFKGTAQQGTGKVKQTLSYPRNVVQARYKGSLILDKVLKKKAKGEKEITTWGG